MKSGFRRWLTETAFLFGIFVVLINFVYLLSYDDPNFPAQRTLLLLPGAMTLSLATFIRTSEKITGVLRWILHCVVSVAGSYLFLVLPATSDTTGSQKLVGFVTVFAVYLVVVLIIALSVKKIRDALKEDRKYKKYGK